jgi:hypothetical protein
LSPEQVYIFGISIKLHTDLFDIHIDPSLGKKSDLLVTFSLVGPQQLCVGNMKINKKKAFSI